IGSRPESLLNHQFDNSGSDLDPLLERHLVLQLHVGFRSLPSAVGPEALGGGTAVIIGTSYKSLGPDATIPVDRRLNRFRYAALYRRQIGEHSFAAGAEWVRDQNNGREASSDRGNYYFRADFGRDAITNFRLGIPSRY